MANSITRPYRSAYIDPHQRVRSGYYRVALKALDIPACPAAWSTPLLPCVQVSLGSFSEVRLRDNDVRTTFRSRHRQAIRLGPVHATSGLVQRSKWLCTGAYLFS